MATAKVYECPMCKEQFTTQRIKKNKKKCPGCGVGLKHEIDRTAGSMVHMWVPDGVAVPVIPKKTGGKIFTRLPRPNDVPSVYISTDESARIHYRVLYVGMYQQTNLSCPKCGKYLHTTNVISGSRQEALCRSTVKPEESESGRWMKCKARTEFIFLSQGASFNAETDV